ncbi:MAG: ATP synthase F0 subunit A [Chitinophagia bacterium]|nr:ATP synthase F0 subunit A [Chitinophagia bacterium]
MRCKRLFSLIIWAFGLFSFILPSVAQEATTTENAPAAATEGERKEGKQINLTELIFGHVADSHEWHFCEIGGKPVAIALPVIIYNATTGKTDMMSAHEFGEFEHETENGETILRTKSVNGYHMVRGMKEKVVSDNNEQIYDFSPTKNVVSMLISVVLILVIMLNVAKQYKTTGTTNAPKGFQNALESAIIFIRDEVAKPNLGHKHLKFMPLLLTIFFFIWINNLLGLLPGGANFTGNIAVTLCLALVSFIVMVVRANGHFWGHLLNPPGVPFGVKLLLVPIEIISMFIKPVALTIRLFANILAGHILILCVISMIFIFAAMNVFAGAGFSVVAIGFSIFLFCLELLVAAIQAFIFTNLTAVFIGQAVEDGHHGHEEGYDHEVSKNEIIA